MAASNRFRLVMEKIEEQITDLTVPESMYIFGLIIANIAIGKNIHEHGVEIDKSNVLKDIKELLQMIHMSTKINIDESSMSSDDNKSVLH